MLTVDLPIPKDKNARIILLGQITCDESDADHLQALLTAIRTRSESSVEPDCLTYRTNRGEEGNRNMFTVFEEYTCYQGIYDHLQSTEFLALMSSNVCKTIDAKYFYEFE